MLNRKPSILMAAVLGLSLATPSFAAQVDYFLKIDGIKGETRAVVEGGQLFLVGEDGRRTLAPDGQYKRKQDGKVFVVKNQKLLPAQVPAVNPARPGNKALAPVDSKASRGVVAPIDSSARRVVAPTHSR